MTTVSDGTHHGSNVGVQHICHAEKVYDETSTLVSQTKPDAVLTFRQMFDVEMALSEVLGIRCIWVLNFSNSVAVIPCQKPRLFRVM